MPALQSNDDDAQGRIGPYQIHQLIGEGGKGAVYIAEQTVPVRRTVALKLIKPGMDSHHVLARFEVERQALALIDHPNIAKVLDAGATESGHPYFVMELVKGLPLNHYCDENRLAPRQRLELFIPICQAVQHAHQKGVIHRDLKPSNVLVGRYDGQPIPKIIDFGIAKATGAKLTERTLYTELGSIVGTLGYMSPEQAKLNQLDIDTRSDIYSLGVLLYELLTGTTPIEAKRLRESTLLDVLRIIRDEDPPRPSNRLSSAAELASIAANRGMESKRLAASVRGELDWTVMKALEKDRDRRYETANGLATDIQRYLNDEPVRAFPPSAAYWARKFARRHWAALVTAGAFLVLLIAAATISTLLAIQASRAEAVSRKALSRATAEQQKARQSAAESRTVLEFFQNNVLAAARPKSQDGGLGPDVTIRAAVDEAAPKIAVEFRDQPVAEASVRHTLGLTYEYLGEPSLAIQQLEAALALRRLTLDARHPDTLITMINLGRAYVSAGRIAVALPLFEETLRLAKAELGPHHATTLETMNDLALAYAQVGRLDDAILLHEETFKLVQAYLGRDHPDTLRTMNALGTTLWASGRLNEAIAVYDEALNLHEAKLGRDHPDTLNTMNNLAAAYQDAGRLDDATRLYEETLRIKRSTVGPNHLSTLATMNNLVTAYKDAGNFKAAVPLFQETLAGFKAKYGEGDPNALNTMNHLVDSYLETKRWVDAEMMARACLALRERSQPDDWRRFHTMSQLGAALSGQAKFAEAEPLLVQGYEGLKAREAQIPAHRKKNFTEAAQRIVPFYEARGQSDKANAWRTKLGEGRR
jgi:serine/threonine protein kinase/tetratricopeptide (TPR) repeat protein